MPWLIFKRDMALAFRRGGGALPGIGFFLIAFTLFAFGLGPETLRAHALEALLISALLSVVLSVPGLFAQDKEDGSLEQYVLQPSALEFLALARLFSFWLTSCLPLLLISPALFLMADANADMMVHGVAALLLVTPALAAIGMFGAALTLNAEREGLVQMLVLLPLYIPALIFAAGLQWMMLAGMLLLIPPLSCYASAALLRMAME